MNNLPKPIDAVICVFAVILLTWRPYFTQGPLNLFELGLYLPGIDAIHRGQVPYRDFFYLRGPFELYMPAMLMNVFGDHVWVLNAYFYWGTVLAFIIAALIAWEVIPSRFILYCFVPVFVARAFPRVVFTFWGGMRYAVGLLGVYCLVRFLKGGSRMAWWLFFAGFLTAFSFFTSIEIGVCLAFACMAAVLVKASLASHDRWKMFWQNTFWYKLGGVVVFIPYVVYLYSTGALMPFLDTVWTVTTRMNAVFLQTEAVPDSIGKFIAALVPGSTNFRQITPVFCYLLFAVYFGWRLKRKQLDRYDAAAATIAVYGIVMYASAFRNLWASQFEMALMPSKIILFFLLARLVAFKTRSWVTWACLAAVFISSTVYAVGRVHKRFFTIPYAQGVRPEGIPRLAGNVVSAQQAEDIVLLKTFLDKNTVPGEKVLMFPELGTLHFILDRPAPSRFAIVTSSWFKNAWHEELMHDLTVSPPRYAVVNKKAPDYFAETHFPVKENLRKYQDVMDLIDSRYSTVAQTPTYRICRLKT